MWYRLCCRGVALHLIHLIQSVFDSHCVHIGLKQEKNQWLVLGILVINLIVKWCTFLWIALHMGELIRSIVNYFHKESQFMYDCFWIQVYYEPLDNETLWPIYEISSFTLSKKDTQTIFSKHIFTMAIGQSLSFFPLFTFSQTLYE